MMRRFNYLRFAFTVSLMMLAFIPSVQGQDKRSKIDITIDTLIAQLDIQVQDRGKLIKVLDTLYQTLKTDEMTKLDNEIEIARLAAIQREALLTMDRMTLDSKSNARVGELIAFLDRVVTRDQQLFDGYVASKESLRFEYERQLAKIKGEQTLLKSVRRDLERLKKFPNDREQTIFFLSSVKSLLDGLSKAHK